MMEFYEAYRDFRYLMDFNEELLRAIAREVLGTLQVPYGEHVVDLSQPFARLTIGEAIRKFDPHFSAADLARREGLTRALARGGVEATPGAEPAELRLALFAQPPEGGLMQPTYLVDSPAIVPPPARRNDANPDLTDRFELYIVGREIANGFSELNDPEDQAA